MVCRDNLPLPGLPSALLQVPLGLCTHSKRVRNEQLTPNNRKYPTEQQRHPGPHVLPPQLGGGLGRGGA